MPPPAVAPTGDDITSKQLRDDLMTLLIAGHETTAAVLTWTFHCIADRPDVVARMREEVSGGGGRWPQAPGRRRVQVTGGTAGRAEWQGGAFRQCRAELAAPWPDEGPHR